jgi:hypothetical protein
LGWGGVAPQSQTHQGMLLRRALPQPKCGATNFERGFSWQEGYSIFSASWTHGLALRRYIAGQESHHRALSFVDELKRLLERNGVKYDPQYLV